VNKLDELKNLVIKHIHQLVDTVKSESRRKVLVHQWILGICKHWKDFVELEGESDESEFIPRISIGIQGIRDRFERGMNKSELIKELKYVFDISTYCYFEYNAREDVLKQIKDYSIKADELFGEDLLSPMYNKFMLSRNIMPIINNAISKIEELNPSETKTLERIRFKDSLDDASGLEKEFDRVLKKVAQSFLKSIKENPLDYEYYEKELEEFDKNANRFGYSNIITKKDKEELEYVKQYLHILNLTKETVNSLRTPYQVCHSINLRTFSVLSSINTKKDINSIAKDITSTIATQLIADLSENLIHYNEIMEKSEKIKGMWKNIIPKFFTERQESFIKEAEKIRDNLLKIKENKKELGEIIEDSFKKLQNIDCNIPKPRKHKPLEPVFMSELEEFDKKEVLFYLFNVYLDILKRYPMEESKIFKQLEALISKLDKNYNIDYLKLELEKIKNLACFELKIKNIFGRPKKNVDIVISQNDKKLEGKKTNNDGLVLFDNLLKGDIEINIANKKKKTYYLEKYHNHNEVRLIK
jgi:hypothetical protein